MTKKPSVLIILDGFGYREAKDHNPTRSVETPTIDALFSENPYVLIEASGEAVGLPEGQMGNSEVGHLHIGAGRKVPQDLVRINQDIKNGVFFKNAVLVQAIQKAKAANKAVHIIGLLSDGGVHSHINHIGALIDLVNTQDVTHYFHAITDGRDTSPKSALNYIHHLNRPIASIIGRYYAMDRDQRWERTQKAVDLLTLGQAAHTAMSAVQAVEEAYARSETDEFIAPTQINSNAIIQDGDVVIFANFRADRARQLTRKLIEKKPALGAYVSLTEYFDDPSIKVAYPPISLHNTLGEFLSQQKLNQLRLAETEKYAHVTYFLNGGVETPYPGEDRTLIPSPKIATYDLQPEMSAIALTDTLVSAIESQQYDVVICNYANPDMIGHTGIEKAAEKAVLVVDECLARVLTAVKKVQGQALITADHGNIELMYDEKTGQPHTAHTTNLVPLIYVGKPAHAIANTGALDDVAPTLLYLMGLPKPADMTGHTLFQLD